MGTLSVDGPRPAVGWVAGLPRKWMTPGQRFVLMVIAADTYDQAEPFTASPTLDDLAGWTGQTKGSVIAQIEALSAVQPGTRPPLLDVDKGTGRRRNEYRLRTDVGNSLWSDETDHNAPVENLRSGRAKPTTSSGRAKPTTSVASGQLVVGRNRPLPSLKTSKSPSVVKPQNARDDDMAEVWRYLADQGIDRAEARWLIERLRADPETRDPVKRVHTVWLNDARAEYDQAQRRAVVEQIQQLKDNGELCEHGAPGGAEPHPVTGDPLCPLCRAGKEAAS